MSGKRALSRHLGEDLRAVVGQRDGMLEMGGWFPVKSHDGPSVGKNLDPVGTHVDHGLDGEDQAGFAA